MYLREYSDIRIPLNFLFRLIFRISQTAGFLSITRIPMLYDFVILYEKPTINHTRIHFATRSICSFFYFNSDAQFFAYKKPHATSCISRNNESLLSSPLLSSPLLSLSLSLQIKFGNLSTILGKNLFFLFVSFSHVDSLLDKLK